MSGLINEDEIIKKRLLIEGDSGNEDRCINKMIKLFVKYCHNTDNAGGGGLTATDQQDDELGGTNAHEMMNAVLSHIELGLCRNHLILDMNRLEQENYENLYKKIDYEIDKSKANIVKSKADLEEARKIRKNRQEYDILAKEINKYEDREKMQNTIEDLEKQLDKLKSINMNLNKKIDLRKKQFNVLLQSLSTLKTIIENDEYNNLNEDDNGLISNGAGTSSQQTTQSTVASRTSSVNAGINRLIDDDIENSSEDEADNDNETSIREKHKMDVEVNNNVNSVFGDDTTTTTTTTTINDDDNTTTIEAKQQQQINKMETE